MFRPDQSFSDREVKLSNVSARQLALQAIRVKGSPVGSDVGPGTSNNASTMVVYDAIVTTAITPASGTTWGTGKVQLYFCDDPTSTTAAQKDVDGDDGAGNTSVKNWYVSSGTIAVGKHCTVIVGAGGGFRILTWDC